MLLADIVKGVLRLDARRTEELSSEEVHAQLKALVERARATF